MDNSYHSMISSLEQAITAFTNEYHRQEAWCTKQSDQKLMDTAAKIARDIAKKGLLDERYPAWYRQLDVVVGVLKQRGYKPASRGKWNRSK